MIFFGELYVYIMESGTCYLLDLVLNEEGRTDIYKIWNVAGTVFERA